MKRHKARATDVEPTIVKEDQFGVETSHPAYGCVVLTRQHSGGGQAMFGTSLLSETVISLKVCEATGKRRHHGDHHSPGKPIVEVRMTEAQFATFVSSMSVGEGTPCTIARMGYDFVPTIPPHDPLENSKREAREAGAAILSNLKSLRGKIAAGIQGLSKTRQADLLTEIDGAIKEASDGMPFILDQYAAHMGELTEEAKIAANGYVQNMVRSLGMEAIAKSQGDVLRIAGSSDDE